VGRLNALHVCVPRRTFRDHLAPHGCGAVHPFLPSSMTEAHQGVYGIQLIAQATEIAHVRCGYILVSSPSINAMCTIVASCIGFPQGIKVT
jgi:hypothetical protein